MGGKEMEIHDTVPAGVSKINNTIIVLYILKTTLLLFSLVSVRVVDENKTKETLTYRTMWVLSFCTEDDC